MSTKKRFAAVLPIVQLRELYQDRYADSQADVRYNPEANSECRVLIDLELPDWAGDEATAAIEDELRYAVRQAICRIGSRLSGIFAEQSKGRQA